MGPYLIRRALLAVPTFMGITFVVFLVTRLVPGGPVERLLLAAKMGQTEGGRGGGGGNQTAAALSEEQVAQLQKYYGFDKPVLVSYGLWLGKIMSLDLGVSTRYSEPVWDTIKEKLPVSLFFGLTSLFLTYLVCIPLGIYKALYHKRLFDHLTSLVVFIGYALPAYVVGIALLVLLASQNSFFPLGGIVSADFSDLSFTDKMLDILWHAALPMTAYMLSSFAVMTFLMKNTLLDHMAADFVRAAVARGLSFRQAVWRHGVRASLIPLATHFGTNLTAVLGGSFLIEKIFNIDGLGLLGYESVVDRDYPVVMGVLVMTAGLQLVGNMVADIGVALADPRVQFG